MNKHLTKDLRILIEQLLNKGLNFTQIANAIRYDRTTIAKEIKKNYYKKYPTKFNNSGNLCSKRSICQKFNCNVSKKCYVEEVCQFLSKPPYVCNPCNKKAGCQKIKHYYDSTIAHDNYLKTLSQSRQGVHITEESINLVNSIIVPLLKENKQSINHIFINNKKILSFSLPTFYTYVDNGIFDIKNIDLLRKVSYKKRKKNKINTKRISTKHRVNRNYNDYLNYIKNNPSASIVLMDTVEGKTGKNEKVILTLFFVKSKVMLMFIRDSNNAESVVNIFSEIKENLGIEKFKELFEVILTDNGSEFRNPIPLETDTLGNKIIKLFYCDSYSSWQKAPLEKNHEFIRYFRKKGHSFNDLNQSDCINMANNINSTARKELDDKTPIECFEWKELLTIFNLKLIEPNEVCLSPKLLQKQKF